MSDSLSAPRVPVLVVGGGIVGLSSALFLLQHGIRPVLVERHAGTSIHPRARGVNGRTMELYRELGLEEEVRRIGAKIAPSVGIYAGSDVVSVLKKRGEGGWLMKRIRRRGVRGQSTKHSPTGPCRCTQDDLEPLLLETARKRGVDARFSTELVDCTQTAGEVTCTLVDRASGAQQIVIADYVIAADGARSPMRQRLGVTQSGAGLLTHQLNIYFRADLTSLVKGREFSMCQVQNASLRGLVVSINNTDLWVLHVSYYPEKGESPADFPEARCIELVRRAIGISDLQVEIKGALPWQSAVRVADGYQHGRIFLAGDAAHSMPPWGGFGANTGVQDAHNLAWKLAAVLAGQAAPQLLETYDVERRPVGRAVAELAGSMNDPQGLMAIKGRFGTLAMLWQMRPVFPYMTMGYGYASRAISLEPGAAPGPGTRELRGRPGTRVPHIWIERAGQRISTLDLCGRGFVLLQAHKAPDWQPAIERIAKQTGVRVEAIRMGGEVRELDQRFASAFGVGAAGAVLVRPDGIVAWRTADARRCTTDELGKRLAQVLCLAPAPREQLEPSVAA